MRKINLLIAPKWGLRKSEIQTFIDNEIERKGVVQGSLYTSSLVEISH